jgi:hypothetical protein
MRSRLWPAKAGWDDQVDRDAFTPLLASVRIG